MVRALIIGLIWLACTAAISLVIARAIRRADARDAQHARDQRRTRSAVAAGRDAEPSSPALGAAAPGSSAASSPHSPGLPGLDVETGRGCALARPPGHGETSTSRRTRPRGTP